MKYMKLKKPANVRICGLFCRANLLFKRQNLFYTLQMTADDSRSCHGKIKWKSGTGCLATSHIPGEKMEKLSEKSK